MRRLSASSLRRLEQLERPRTERSGGVLLVPAILGIDEWSAAATSYYAQFMAAEAADRRESDEAHAARTALPITPTPFQPGTYERTLRS